MANSSCQYQHRRHATLRMHTIAHHILFFLLFSLCFSLSHGASEAPSTAAASPPPPPSLSPSSIFESFFSPPSTILVLPLPAHTPSSSSSPPSSLIHGGGNGFGGRRRSGLSNIAPKGVHHAPDHRGGVHSPSEAQLDQILQRLSKKRNNSRAGVGGEQQHAVAAAPPSSNAPDTNTAAAAADPDPEVATEATFALAEAQHRLLQSMREHSAQGQQNASEIAIAAASAAAAMTPFSFDNEAAPPPPPGGAAPPAPDSSEAAGAGPAGTEEGPAGGGGGGVVDPPLHTSLAPTKDKDPRRMHLKLNGASLNDTCTLSTLPNSTRLVMTCPGCIVYVPLNHSNFDIEQFFSKAINYAYLCSFLALVQILVVLRQMRSADSVASSMRLCRYTISMQALLDSYQSMFHFFTALSCEALFNAFVVTAFLQFLLFSLFEITFLMQLYKTAHPEEFNGGWEQSRRAIRWLYVRFYSTLIVGLLLVFIFPALFYFMITVLYGFWIPQIVWQAIQGSRRGFQPRYISIISLTRLVLPLYFWLCPVNFLNSQQNLPLVALLVLWVGAQMLVLRLQKKWGARFFVPARFLPARYDYHRSIPLLSLQRRSQASPSPSAAENGDVNIELSGLSAAVAAGDDPKPSQNAEHVVIRVGENELTIAGAGSNAASSSTTASSSSTSALAAADTSVEDENPCPICYSELEAENPYSLMVCPCDHIFHAHCLRKWMQQKNECPVCRAVLPIEEAENESTDEDEEDEDAAARRRGGAAGQLADEEEPGQLR